MLQRTLEQQQQQSHARSLSQSIQDRKYPLGMPRQSITAVDTQLQKASGTYAKYLSNQKQVNKLKSEWSSVRKKDTASLKAYLKSAENVHVIIKPDAYDARLLGVVTAPKDQKDCGTCVAFAVASAVETAVAMAYRGSSERPPVLTMSMQTLYFCEINNPRSCSTGWDLKAALKVLGDSSRSQVGLYQDKCLPYDITFERSCQLQCTTQLPAGEFRWTIMDNVDDAQRIILRDGGILTSMYVYDDLLDYFGKHGKSAIYKTDPNASHTSEPEAHAVHVVGYNNTEGWLLVKNSFGPDWADGGYFKVRSLR